MLLCSVLCALCLYSEIAFFILENDGEWEGGNDEGREEGSESGVDEAGVTDRLEKPWQVRYTSYTMGITMANCYDAPYVISNQARVGSGDVEGDRSRTEIY
jgi:hypothetical protein